MENEIKFLDDFAAQLGATFDPEGECGFGRECVGITKDDNWVDLGEAEECKSPKDAYHKHPCLAVLGRGDEAIEQLYAWCKELHDAGYTKIENISDEDLIPHLSPQAIGIMNMMGSLAPPTLVKD